MNPYMYLGAGCVLAGKQTSWGRDELATRIDAWARRLRDAGARVVGLLADNGPEWLACDLGIRAAGAVCVPLPSFFSDRQLRHALTSAGVDHVITQWPQRVQTLAAGLDVLADNVEGLALLQRDVEQAVALHPGTTKITFTSGSTGQPKGVCLDDAGAVRLASVLAESLAPLGVSRHLSVLPYATLLENVAGAYAALSAGATVCALPMSAVGLTDGGGFDPERFLGVLHAQAPDSVIMLPEQLKALVVMGEAGAALPSQLKFIAVGGGLVGRGLVERAQALGLPVHEGYGLSECGSVVSLNPPGAVRPGSVGRVLPHVRVRLAADDEILVSGNAMRGYLGEPACGEEIATGDIGALDADGYLYVSGRKKNQFVTSFGRNVNPEWPESLLLQSRLLRQAVVFGEALPANVAVIVPMPGVSNRDVAAVVARANRALPGYARVRYWIGADQPFSVANGQATANGRVRRAAIEASYQDRIEDAARTYSLAI